MVLLDVDSLPEVAADHVQELVFAFDVAVERHRSHPELACHPADADGLGSFAIGDRERRGDDLISG